MAATDMGRTPHRGPRTGFSCLGVVVVVGEGDDDDDDGGRRAGDFVTELLGCGAFAAVRFGVRGLSGAGGSAPWRAPSAPLARAPWAAALRGAIGAARPRGPVRGAKRRCAGRLNGVCVCSGIAARIGTNGRSVGRHDTARHDTTRHDDTSAAAARRTRAATGHAPSEPSPSAAARHRARRACMERVLRSAAPSAALRLRNGVAVGARSAADSRDRCCADTGTAGAAQQGAVAPASGALAARPIRVPGVGEMFRRFHKFCCKYAMVLESDSLFREFIRVGVAPLVALFAPLLCDMFQHYGQLMDGDAGAQLALRAGQKLVAFDLCALTAQEAAIASATLKCAIDGARTPARRQELTILRNFACTLEWVLAAHRLLAGLVGGVRPHRVRVAARTHGMAPLIARRTRPRLQSNNDDALAPRPMLPCVRELRWAADGEGMLRRRSAQPAALGAAPRALEVRNVPAMGFRVSRLADTSPDHRLPDSAACTTVPRAFERTVMSPFTPAGFAADFENGDVSPLPMMQLPDAAANAARGPVPGPAHDATPPRKRRRHHISRWAAVHGPDGIPGQFSAGGRASDACRRV